MHSHCAHCTVTVPKKSTYANMWSLDGSLAGARWTSIAGSWSSVGNSPVTSFSSCFHMSLILSLRRKSLYFLYSNICLRTHNSALVVNSYLVPPLLLNKKLICSSQVDLERDTFSLPFQSLYGGTFSPSDWVKGAVSIVWPSALLAAIFFIN